ncbi:hypothetical protein EDB80DRAFT_777500 [Ilyonectria destructans]|nr:hypothetical protein EDB80DRAFT_777500 [Ilyonectria destructans]
MDDTAGSPRTSTATAQRPFRLSRTACERCRRQKLRCSREHPICSRCDRFSATCRYPQLVDRKLLAAARGATRADRADQASSAQAASERLGGDQAAGTTAGGRGTAVPPVTNTDRPDNLAQPSPASVPSADLPPRAVGLGLLDIYFERLYNAPLLFSRSELFESYLDGTVPSFLLKALFALSSIFLQKPRSQRLSPGARVPVTSADLAALASYARNGYAWANAAAQEVLQLADRPTLQTIQTLACLSVYWFSRSDMDRARIHIVIAYTSCSNFLPFSSTEKERESLRQAFDVERKRCCFWACWASLCVSAIPDAYARNAWEEACHVPLPLSIDGLRFGLDSSPRECMDQNWHCTPSAAGSSAAGAGDRSLMGELLKLMGIWARVQVLVRYRSKNADLPQVEALSAAANRVFDPQRFPPSFGGGRTPGKDSARLLGLHSLYHLCRMVLLCPLVSLFSGRRQEAATVTNNARADAEIVAQHALVHCRLIREYILTPCDMSKISPLTAFASFVAASILLMLAKSSIRRSQDAQEELTQTLLQLSVFVQDTFSVLDTLQTYWKPLGPMARELHQRAEGLPTPSHEIRIFMSLETPEQIRIPLSGVNSPIQDEDGITVTYIESPECSAARGDGAQSYPATSVNVARPSEDQILDDETRETNEMANRRPLDGLEMYQEESFIGDCDELFDFEDMAHWDLDFLSLYPPQVA